MKKSSQIQSVDASTSAVPERVSVAMAEIAEDMCEGLLALAVGAGLQVMAALMEADVTALAGPKGRHDGARTAVRHGREPGSVTLGGRRVPVTRPRVRARRRRQQRSPVCRELHGALSGQDGRGLQQRPLGKPVGLHFKGPVWVSTVDGSEVGAAPVATVNREGAIPQLLLKANQNQGQGMFSKVTYVQRLRTTGGVAPAGSCPEGSQHAIRYSALYRFWAATPDLFNVLAPGRRCSVLRGPVRTEAVPEGLPFACDAEGLAAAQTWNLQTDAGDLDIAFQPSGTHGYSDLRRDAKPAQLYNVTVHRVAE